jgi:pilus assembly protein Flp/PilA
LPARLHSVRTRMDRGATATEYAILVAFIAIAMAVAVFAFGQSLSSFYTAIASKVGAVLS